ncbi:hypothetical protein Godav_023478 [Gossypium davidsonii]|uniref:Uncharacterized protein n=1 Tax=Gossypium davidsonii TaxID=34287 RepID=A0A7J8SSD2_GOSDV|nr:hypothetical protein [Gossypium davidsonii]
MKPLMLLLRLTIREISWLTSLKSWTSKLIFTLR